MLSLNVDSSGELRIPCEHRIELTTRTQAYSHLKRQKGRNDVIIASLSVCGVALLELLCSQSKR